MSSHYNPIPIESDHEDNDMPEHTPMEEDHTRTEQTRSTERANFFDDHDASSDSDPEEDPPSSDDRAPLLATNTETQPTRQTARIRAAMPSSLPEALSRSSPPPSSSNARTNPGLRLWDRTLRILQQWKDSYEHTPAPQMESSPAIRQEFLMDTTPMIVDKITRHEERLDMVEDVVMDLPGPEALAELRHDMDTTDNNVAYVNNEVQELKKKVEQLTQDSRSKDHAIHKLGYQLWDLQTSNTMTAGTRRDNRSTYFGRFPGGSSGGN